ncbi:MAG: hypothetical protein KW806_02445, partial [Candidatus Yanofskybacteria bacterium]|nr:hypothetical protein [Candidatus Yanofskybacteria bacterium]
CLQMLNGGQAVPCPEHGIFAFLTKSAHAFQSISTAYLVGILAVFAASLLMAVWLEPIEPQLQHAFFTRRILSGDSYHKRVFSSWFSLHENSPSVL